MINGPFIALAFVFALLILGQVLIILVFGRDKERAKSSSPVPRTNKSEPIVITLDPIDEPENPT